MFGRQNFQLPAGTKVIFTETALHLPEREIPYEELFYRKSDAIVLHAKTVELFDRCYANSALRLTPEKLTIGDDTFNPDEVPHLEAVTDEIVVPREAMGFGDVKFMAAIGAFLGWKATIFSLLFSSILGAAVGVALICLQSGNGQPPAMRSLYRFRGDLLDLWRRPPRRQPGSRHGKSSPLSANDLLTDSRYPYLLYGDLNVLAADHHLPLIDQVEIIDFDSVRQTSRHFARGLIDLRRDGFPLSILPFASVPSEVQLGALNSELGFELCPDLVLTLPLALLHHTRQRNAAAETTIRECQNLCGILGAHDRAACARDHKFLWPRAIDRISAMNPAGKQNIAAGHPQSGLLAGPGKLTGPTIRAIDAPFSDHIFQASTAGSSYLPATAKPGPQTKRSTPATMREITAPRNPRYADAPGRSPERIEAGMPE
jgi:hypothetical protein